VRDEINKARFWWFSVLELCSGKEHGHREQLKSFMPDLQSSRQRGLRTGRVAVNSGGHARNHNQVRHCLWPQRNASLAEAPTCHRPPMARSLRHSCKETWMLSSMQCGLKLILVRGEPHGTALHVCFSDAHRGRRVTDRLELTSEAMAAGT